MLFTFLLKNFIFFCDNESNMKLTFSQLHDAQGSKSECFRLNVNNLRNDMFH
jgi:hypothetical protein